MLSTTASFLFFFFQAEDGIRDVAVTGVQTCALPISVCRKAGGPGQAAQFRFRLDRHGEVKIQGIPDFLRKRLSTEPRSTREPLLLSCIQVQQCGCHRPSYITLISYQNQMTDAQ